MAGPVASLLLLQPLTETQIAELKGWLYEIGRVSSNFASISPPTQGKTDLADFSFNRYPPLVTKSQPHNCGFSLELVNPETCEEFFIEEDEKEIMQARLGFIPKELVVAYAGCNGQLDHQLLAHLLLDLAEKFGANMIDMLGRIENRPDLPGKVIEVPSAEHPRFTPIMIDVEFLKNWLNHPDFHMIK